MTPLLPWKNLQISCRKEMYKCISVVKFLKCWYRSTWKKKRQKAQLEGEEVNKIFETWWSYLSKCLSHFCTILFFTIRHSYKVALCYACVRESLHKPKAILVVITCLNNGIIFKQKESLLKFALFLDF